jgi:hypothetical protein
MTRNASTGGPVLKRSRKAVRTVTAKQEAEAGELKGKPAESRRMYTAQVRVIDPEGQEILNLTKLAFEDDRHGKGLANLEIREVLEILVEAAGEWST